MFTYCFSCFYLSVCCVCSQCCSCFLCSQDWYSRPNWLSSMTTDFSRATLKFTWSRFVRKEKKISLHVTRILLLLFVVGVFFSSALSLFLECVMFFKGVTKDKNRINFGAKQGYLTAGSPAITYACWLGLKIWINCFDALLACWTLKAVIMIVFLASGCIYIWMPWEMWINCFDTLFACWTRQVVIMIVLLTSGSIYIYIYIIYVCIYIYIYMDAMRNVFLVAAAIQPGQGEDGASNRAAVRSDALLWPRLLPILHTGHHSRVGESGGVGDLFVHAYILGCVLLFISIYIHVCVCPPVFMCERKLCVWYCHQIYLG